MSSLRDGFPHREEFLVVERPTLKESTTDACVFYFLPQFFGKGCRV